MSNTMPQPDLIGGARERPALRLPPRDLFGRRAQRARTLATDHDLAGFLRFAAALAEAQQDELDRLTPAGRPPQALLDHCRAGGLSPLAYPAWQPEPPWPALTRRLADRLATNASDWLPAQARTACDRIREADDSWLVEQAARLLDPAAAEPPDPACAPLIGAALQTAWTAQAILLDAADLDPPARADLCPVCGFGPVAAILRAGGAEDGARYLHCGLCGSEWHAVRSQCSLCGNGRDMAYLGIAALSQAVTAETCPECRGYLKICRMDKDLDVDPWADDLATLALDWLVAQEGFDRAGMSFMMVQPETTATAA